MAVINSRQIDEFRGKLILEVEYVEDDIPLFTAVYYQPSPERLKKAGINTDDVNFYKKKILEIYSSWYAATPNSINRIDHLSIYPINTLPNSDFLQPKYAKINSISLEGFDYEMPETLEEVEDLLGNLPTGFVKDYDFGLGLQKDYRFIINAIEENTEIINLLITNKEKTLINTPSIIMTLKALKNIDLDAVFDSYMLNYDEYDAIRRGVDKITRDYQSNGRTDKSIFAYNALLNIANPAQYPEKYRPYKKDTILKFISDNDMEQADLSVADQKEVINLISKNKKKLAEHQPEALMKLHNDIELVTLENLIQKFEEMLNKSLSEREWQKLFNKNSFILKLAFGFPIMKVCEQVCVGGGTIFGNGDKFPDFLVKNNITNNTALIEIKTPCTKLLNKNAYRESVYTPSNELSGSINQVLDQKYKFQKQIATLKENSRIYDFESYSVSCVLIIGKMPEDNDRKKSFELFRGNSKDVEIITFDELLGKLRQLHVFLSSDG
ncbi:MAG: DUF4263 domain-containing protein [Methylococcales bacterium]|nr:DUF4263 domain-containing protein [Methylococcales bacterium]MDP3839032.1 DUF4263 domain-containing protein [Methylococcales bacterium]